MTTLVCWCGVDQRTPSSLYIASDSRITWGSSLGAWDAGRKLFRFTGRPDVLGFAGDVLFTLTALSQLVTLVDSQAIELPEEPEERFAVVRMRIESALAQWPNGRELGTGVSIVYATRKDSGMKLSFHVFGMSWRKDRGWRFEKFETPMSKSGVVCAYGSGAESAQEYVERWMQEDVSGRTSRSVFSGFCDSIESGKDQLSGGPPQLMGIYREGQAQDVGVIWNEKRFLAGVEVASPPNNSALQWRDRLFQRCDVLTLGPISGAQRHARPKRLG